MISKEKFDELDQKQNELRKIRNEYADKQQEIQKQIDQLEIDKYDAEQYIGKIIVCKDMLGAVYHAYTYMIVDRVERLYAGPRFYGKTIEITFSRHFKIGNSILMYERSECSNFKWNQTNDIKTIEPEELKKQINKVLNEFDYGEEMNKLKTKHE